MIVNTKHFGEIEITDDKVITFDSGLLGLEEYKRYTLLYNNEDGERPAISWLQSLDEPLLSLPVIIPTIIKPDYNPTVEDELLRPIGELTEENLSVLVTITVPSDLTQMTTNLKAPIIINSDTRKGCQIVVENPEYEIKYHIYDILAETKARKGGNAC